MVKCIFRHKFDTIYEEVQTVIDTTTQNRSMYIDGGEIKKKTIGRNRPVLVCIKCGEVVDPWGKRE